MKDILDAVRPYHIEFAAILLFAVAMVAEKISDKYQKLSLYENRSTRFNFLIGGISFVSETLMSLSTFPLLLWVQDHWAIFSLHDGYWYEMVLLFVVLDFLEYWFHRLSHQINLMWLAHIVHHQDKEFNLSVGFRNSFFVYFFNIFFYALLPVIGFGVMEILFLIFMQGVYQLFIHTKVVKTLGILEYIFVTPSAHRVHHGKNEQYLDKNYGKVFIIWDRIFGTYEKETEPVEYGVKENKEYDSAMNAIIDPWKLLLLYWRNAGSRARRRELLWGRPEVMLSEKE